jgi:hypothetical protein
MTRVVFRHESNNETTHGAHEDGCVPRGQCDRVATNSLVQRKRRGQKILRRHVHRRAHEEGSGDELQLERTFHVSFLLDWHNVRGQKTANQADKETDSRNNNWKDHGIPATRPANAASKDEGGAGRFGKTTKQVTAHTGHVTDVVSNIVGNGRGIAGVVFGNAMNDLACENDASK